MASGGGVDGPVTDRKFSAVDLHIRTLLCWLSLSVLYSTKSHWPRGGTHRDCRKYDVFLLVVLRPQLEKILFIYFFFFEIAEDANSATSTVTRGGIEDERPQVVQIYVISA